MSSKFLDGLAAGLNLSAIGTFCCAIVMAGHQEWVMAAGMGMLAIGYAVESYSRLRAHKARTFVVVECGGCRNTWSVRDAPEFMPQFCCYCGGPVAGIQTEHGEMCGRNGLPLPSGKRGAA